MVCWMCNGEATACENACGACLLYSVMRALELSVLNAYQSGNTYEDAAYVLPYHDDMPEPFIASDGIFIPEVDAEWDEPDYEAFAYADWYEDDSREDYTPMFRTWNV